MFNTMRRKKIRTRKSLNEIRRRAHPETRSTRTADVKGNNQERINFITSNRLTIKMFPKAVRSETITRSDEVINKFILNRKDALHDKDFITNEESVVDKCSNSEISTQSTTNDEDEPKCDGSAKCPESRGLEGVGSFQRDGNTAVRPVFHSTNALTPMTGASSNTHCIDDKYYIYEQFMSEISAYLKKTVAKSLLREDFIENLKGQLFNIQGKLKHNVATLKRKPIVSNNHISNVLEEIMVEDPMDYIRLRYSTMQNTPAYGSKCRNRSSDSVASLHHIHSPQTVQSSASRTDLSDTPEYIYFPHKLN